MGYIMNQDNNKMKSKHHTKESLEKRLNIKFNTNRWQGLYLFNDLETQSTLAAFNLSDVEARVIASRALFKVKEF